MASLRGHDWGLRSSGLVPESCLRSRRILSRDRGEIPRESWVNRARIVGRIVPESCITRTDLVHSPLPSPDLGPQTRPPDPCCCSLHLLGPPKVRQNPPKSLPDFLVNDAAGPPIFSQVLWSNLPEQLDVLVPSICRKHADSCEAFGGPGYDEARADFTMGPPDTRSENGRSSSGGRRWIFRIVHR